MTAPQSRKLWAVIVRKESTRADVERAIGSPAFTAMMPDGGRMASYSYSKMDASLSPGSFIPFTAGLFGEGRATNRTQQLQVTYDAAGIVKDYEFSDNSMAALTHVSSYSVVTVL